jgi:hypothetical protein
MTELAKLVESLKTCLEILARHPELEAALDAQLEVGSAVEMLEDALSAAEAAAEEA